MKQYNTDKYNLQLNILKIQYIEQNDVIDDMYIIINHIKNNHKSEINSASPKIIKESD